MPMSKRERLIDRLNTIKAELEQNLMINSELIGRPEDEIEGAV